MKSSFGHAAVSCMCIQTNQAQAFCLSLDQHLILLANWYSRIPYLRI